MSSNDDTTSAEDTRPDVLPAAGWDPSWSAAFDAPVRISLTGEPTDADWPLGNEVTVEVVDRANAGFADDTDETRDEVAWAADTFDRSLVRVDTNYKSTRPGSHPVELTRADAVELATALLRAVDDTFNPDRVGNLRAVEALEVLQRLADLDLILSDLRWHTLDDLAKAPERAAQARANRTTSVHVHEDETDQAAPGETPGGAQ